MSPNGTFLLTATGVGLVLGQWLSLLVNGTARADALRVGLAACSRCAGPITWADAVPLVRWLFGPLPCRGCGLQRPFREPLVAIGLALAFAASAVHFQFGAEFFHAALAITLICAVALADLVFWVMPFGLTLPGIALGVASAFLSSRVTWYQALLGAVLGFTFVFACELLAEARWGDQPLGGGVKYLVAMVGGFLGPRQVLEVIPLALLHALVLGGLLLLLRERASIPTEREPIAREEDEPLIESRWRPLRSMMQAGPLIAIAALELLLLPAS